MLVKKQRPNHKVILDATTELAIAHGLDKTYIDMIAKKISKPHSIVYNYYTSMDNLRCKVLENAIKEEIIEIIVDGLVSKRINKYDLSEEIMNKVSLMFQSRILG